MNTDSESQRAIPESGHLEPTVGEFKGNRTITLKVPARDPKNTKDFSFGLLKAETIMANLGAIEHFVEDHPKKGAYDEMAKIEAE